MNFEDCTFFFFMKQRETKERKRVNKLLTTLANGKAKDGSATDDIRDVVI